MGLETGCEGTFVTSTGDHGGNDNLYWVVSARYADEGGDGVPPLSGQDEALLQPRRKQAEFFTAAQGVGTTRTPRTLTRAAGNGSAT